MNRPVRITPEAEAELQAAAEWYEMQQDGLGTQLLKEAAAAYLQIAEGDHGTPVPQTVGGARRTPIRKFPLWVVFIERDTDALVVAYAHQRRRPGYWLRRVRSS